MDTPDIHSQEKQVPQKTPTRKRQIDSNDNEREPQPKRARLTGKNLALFDKMSRRKKPSDPTDDSTTTKTISTTTSGFADQARRNGILPPLHSKPPTNLQKTRERLAETRTTASPTESVYEDYVHKVGKAPNEATMVFEVGGKLLKEYPNEGYNRTFSQAFTSFPESVGFNNGLSAPQPDFVEGLEVREYAPFPVEENISGAILYKNNPYSLALPHLAGEWKGPDGSMKTAQMQSAYDGAALVYGRNQALTYMETPDPTSHSEVTTFTTDGTQLNFYSHHATKTDDDTLEYHQYPLTSVSLTGSFKEYKEGRKHLRNAQDHAREESYKVKNDLQSHWKTSRNQPVPLPTIVDEDGYEIITQQPPSTHGNETGYEAVKPQPAYQQERPTSTKPKKDRKSSSHSYSTRSSTKSPQPTRNRTSSISRKKKTSSSHTSSHKSSHTSSHGTSRHSSKPKGY